MTTEPLPSIEGTLAAQTSSSVPTKSRVLPPEEWQEKLTGLPVIAEMGMPNPNTCQVVVLEREDTAEIVGYWFLFMALHVEPLWIHPDHQHRVGVIRRMWNTMRDLLASVGATSAYGVIPDESLVSIAQQARRIGFRKAPGALYFINLTEPEPKEPN